MVTLLKDNYKAERTTCFYCYNPRLRKFLQTNGLTYIDREINKTTGFPYWTFGQSERLSRLIQQYKNGKVTHEKATT